MGRPIPRFQQQKDGPPRWRRRLISLHTTPYSSDSETDPDDMSRSGHPIVLVHPYNGRPEETTIQMRPHPMYYQETEQSEESPTLIIPPWRADDPAYSRSESDGFVTMIPHVHPRRLYEEIYPVRRQSMTASSSDNPNAQNAQEDQQQPFDAEELRETYTQNLTSHIIDLIMQRFETNENRSRE